VTEKDKPMDGASDVTEQWWTALLADGSTRTVAVTAGEDECAWEGTLSSGHDPEEDASGGAETPLEAVAVALIGVDSVGVWREDVQRPAGTLDAYVFLALEVRRLEPVRTVERYGFDHYDGVCAFCGEGEHENPIAAKYTAAWRLPPHRAQCAWVLAMELCGEGEVARAARIGTPAYQGKQP